MTNKISTTDWRNPADYPVLKKTSAGIWAWEFLRRNPLYRANWARLKKVYSEIDGENEGIFPHELPDGIMDDYDCEPAPLAGETYNEYKLRTGGWISCHTLESSFQRKWGIDYIKSPDEGYGYGWPIFFKTTSLKGMPFFACDTPGKKWENSQFSPEQLGEIAIMFDVKLPIDAQLKRAARGLKSWRSFLKRDHGLEVIEPRNHTDKFHTYLRILDAHEAGVDIKEMGNQLFPLIANDYPDYARDKTLRNMLKAAKRYRDKDYIFIPLILKK